ncbi:MAG: GxxExxY protein [Muribaculaceae bacterium]|nr:GxxExxY protein [Muribaculaceae bacterium]
MIIYPSESYKIIGCMMRVHRELGCGFLERVYQEALEQEFIVEGVPFQREVNLNIYYRGVPLQQNYIADFVCYDKIIVELKAISKLSDVEKAQVINYLKATGYELGILANFGETSLKTERLCNISKTTPK